MAPTIEFFFEIGSPYSYLAATQIERVASEEGTDVVWRPMVLGAIFKETGNRPPAQVPAKGSYMFKDLLRWAERYGVEFNWPSNFPMNTIAAHRAILAAEDVHGAEAAKALTLAIYKAYWVDDRDVSAPDVLAEVVEAQGLDVDAISGGVADQSIKDALREHTGEAQERGVFGAPTFFVGDEMFWGNDRLDFVREAVQRHS